MTICAAIPENLNWLLIASSMLGKLCITASYGVIYILSAENFPTVIRNAGKCEQDFAKSFLLKNFLVIVNREILKS
jgi:hypothetical protein